MSEPACAECERVKRGIEELFNDGFLYCQCNCGCDGDGHSEDCDVCGPCLVAAVVQNRSPLHPSVRVAAVIKERGGV